MSNFGKVLVFATLVFSLMFMGASVAVYYGGPNWESKVHNLEAQNLSGYSFEKSATIPGQRSTWTATKKKTSPALEDEQVNSGTVLPKVIIATQAHKLQQQRDELAALQPQIDQIQQATDYTKQLIEADVAALDVKEQLLVQELQLLDEEIESLKQQAIAQTQLAFSIQEETERRREDVLRLKHYLDSLRTDLAYAEQLQEELRRQIGPIEINNNYLDSRKQQLVEQTSGQPAYEENGAQ